MNSTTFTPTQARSQLFDLVSRAGAGDEIEITPSGKDPVIMIAKAEYEALLETADILSSPELVSSIEQGEAEARQGLGVDLDDL